jgi:hypothetical protein
MFFSTLFKAGVRKFQENSSSWGSLFLWFCGVTILMIMMLFFAHSDLQFVQ